MADSTTSTTDAKPKQKRNRSPQYPSISLPDALDRVHEIYDHEQFNWVNARIASSHWGYSPKSSSSIRLLSALTQYGLIERSKGANRQIRLTELAKSIIRDSRPVSPDRDAALREAALKPVVNQKAWTRWGTSPPSTDQMAHELEHELGFNPNSIPVFIAAYEETIAHVGMDKSGQSAHLEADTEGDTDVPLDTDSGMAEGPCDLAMSQKQEAAMPSVAEATRTDWDVTIPLIGGGRAILRVPIPVTEADYDLLTGVIASHLKAMKAAIVREPSSGDRET